MKNLSILTFAVAITLFYSFSTIRYAIACDGSNAAAQTSSKQTVASNEQNVERGLSSDEKGTVPVAEKQEAPKRPYRHIGKLMGD